MSYSSTPRSRRIAAEVRAFGRALRIAGAASVMTIATEPIVSYADSRYIEEFVALGQRAFDSIEVVER